MAAAIALAIALAFYSSISATEARSLAERRCFDPNAVSRPCPCPQSCERPNRYCPPSIFCFPACVCKDGYTYGRRGCVPKDTCGAELGCGPNEEYATCSSCERTCEDYAGRYPGFGGKRRLGSIYGCGRSLGFALPGEECRAKCVCRNGYARVGDECVPKAECSANGGNPAPGDGVVPSIGSCVYKNRLYADGQKFKPDDCSFCTCVKGTARCAVVRCALPICINGAKPVKVPGQCCPKCLGGSSRFPGIQLPEASTIIPPKRSRLPVSFPFKF